MPMEIVPPLVRLAGAVEVEEAEALCAHLVAHPDHVVSVEHCTRLHGAVFQVLVALGAPVIDTPAEGVLPGGLARHLVRPDAPPLASTDPRTAVPASASITQGRPA